ncbi:MAG TPA: YbhB/YbcL family Raf kinase inhibitor-like protein [Candidatus Saccharimonadales bacterium]|nr:YbhB/YbcL family Raf kinase inhibitor-like protein [Candidatus Saccharimonadales bacterium]
MQLLNPAFENSKRIPEKYGAKGRNKNPPLIIKNAPGAAVSFAVIMHDPDAVRGDFLHWIIWNIPGNTVSIDEGIAPKGATQGLNDMRKAEYLRPLPPSGTGVHRYVFNLYALDTLFDLPHDAERSTVEKMIEKHVIAEASLTGLYSR